MKELIFVFAFLSIISFDRNLINFLIKEDGDLPLVSNQDYIRDLCECKKKDTIQVCYLPKDPFCRGINSCRYSLDGELLQRGLVEKLNNPQNFGKNGIIESHFGIKPLSNIPDVNTIESAGCDIFFVGSFNVDTINNRASNRATSVPIGTLETIKEWSMKCKNNLAIIGQAEAVPWGYEFENENTNPNMPIQRTSVYSIFDGPFGKVDSFNQIGNFLGILTKTPASGMEILSVDSKNLPSIVLDELTNDIILGDVTLFASFEFLGLSRGNMIINDLDKLVCNLFALGSILSKGERSKTQTIRICPNETYELPGGRIAENEGFYFDTLQTSKGCDSIILTEVMYLQSDTTKIDSQLCSNKNFSIVVNGNLYDEFNPIGIEPLINQYGCDSIINIDLNFNPTSFTLFQDTACERSGTFYQIGGIRFDEQSPKGQLVLTNQYGCDSLIHVDLNFVKLDSSFEEIWVCKDETITIEGNSYSDGSRDSIMYSRNDQCDSVYQFEVVSYPEPNFILDSNIIVNSASNYQFQNDIPPSYQVSWFPPNGLSCNDCPNPVLQVDANETKYLIQIVDDNKCSHKFEFPISYNRKPYIPSAFSPNNDGVNDNFQIFFKNSAQSPRISLFQIFDRWGGLVYNGKGLNPFTSQGWWDGTNQGTKLNTGVYVYQIEVEYPNGEKIEFNGDVNLVR